MYPIYTVIVSIGAVLSTVVLCMVAGIDERSFVFFVCWTGAPYLGYCGLAFARRAHHFAVFVATILSGGFATLLYWSDIWPQVVAESRGEEVMNCAGPLIELGFPVVQWVLVVALFVATMRRPSTATA
jgi:hypothetical protein